MASAASLKSGNRVGFSISTGGYSFVALVGGVRMLMHLEVECTSDAEAGLVAISAATRLIAVEVWHDGAFIYRTSPTGDRRKPLRSPSPQLPAAYGVRMN